MSKWTNFMDRITFECDWKDIGLIGLCAGSLGALMGMVIPEKYKNAAAFTTGSAFFLSAVAFTVRSIKASGEDAFEDENFEEWDDWDEEDPGFVMRITAKEE